MVGSILCEYAGGLAAQGCLQGALNVLEGIEEGDLQDRLARALGRTRGRVCKVALWFSYYFDIQIMTNNFFKCDELEKRAVNYP